MEEREHGKDKPTDVCRLCLGSTDVTVPIGQHGDKTTSIIEKIRYCTSLVVKVSDDYPQNICTTCARNLDLTFNFKSKAIASDLELSKNGRRDDNFTYIQVSDDPLNMTYKLNLEEQDSSTNVGESCVYNIVDGDELTIEPVNTLNDTNKIIDTNDTTSNEGNESTFTVSINCDNKTSEVIISKLNEKSNSSQYSNTNNKKKNASLDLKRNSDKALLGNEKNKLKKIKVESDIDCEKPLLIVKNGKVVYICGVCNFEAESMGLLRSHQTRVHLDNIGGFKCAECPGNFKTLGILKRHNLMHHDTSHVCKFCEKKFLNKSSLDRHINSIHNNTPLEFECVKCHAYFDTMDKMEDHLVVHYASPFSVFNCNHCDRSFTTYSAKNKHIDLEHMFEIECDICHVVLPTKEAMEKHNYSVHQPKKKGNKMYACTKCGKYFSGIKDILIHRETHLSN